MYHTILVGGLLCIAQLDLTPAHAAPLPHHAVGYVQPATVDRALNGAAAHLERVLDISPGDARQVIASIAWSADETGLNDLVLRWSNAGASPAIAQAMAIDGSIVMAAHNYTLSPLAAALRVAGRTGTTTPTVTAGADFLARQSLVNGAIGANWLEAEGGGNLDSVRATAALANCLATLGDRLAVRAAA